MGLSMFGCRAFSMGVTASAKREYSFENAPRCSANSKQIDGRYKTTGIRKKHSGPASGRTLSFDERPSNRSAVGDPCDVQLGPVRPRIISASSNGSSTIPFKNDGRQVTHLCAMRFSVNILTSRPIQISATMGIDEGPLRWNIVDVCRYPPEMPS